MIADGTKQNGVKMNRLHTAASRAFRRGDLVTAKRALKRCVNLDRTDADAWEQYGNIHYTAGNYPLAVSSFHRAMRHRSLTVSSEIHYALSLARTGSIEEAFALFQKLEKSDDVEASDLLLIAIGLHAVSRTHLAMQACRRALQLDPGCAQAYFDLGFYCDKSGFPTSTVESLMRKALKCDPRNARFQVGLACLLTRSDRSQEAWLIVRDFGSTSISTMTCSCCLERLISLYRNAEDERRLVICHQRLVELRLRGCGFDC